MALLMPSYDYANRAPSDIQTGKITVSWADSGLYASQASSVHRIECLQKCDMSQGACHRGFIGRWKASAVKGGNTFANHAQRPLALEGIVYA